MSDALPDVPISTPLPPRVTSEIVADVEKAITHVEGEVKSGRRTLDWRALVSVKSELSLAFWLFGALLDEQKKPSMSRILFALWTYVGWEMERYEMHRLHYQTPLSNAAWQAWYLGEALLAVAVFGPRVASYFSAGNAGAVAASTIAGAIRDGYNQITTRSITKTATGDDKG
jgi:hypothetical protein